jgi:hypothetical protein
MPASLKMRNILAWMALVIVIVSLCWALDGLLTEKPIESDSRQNLRAAYNICTWGVFSTNSGTLQKPAINHYREPLHPFVGSFFLLYYKYNANHLTDNDFAQGPYARLVKRVNLFWAFWVLLGSAVLSMVMIKNKLFSALVVLLVYACFLRNPQYIDTFLSEIPTAALLLWTSIVFIFCVRGHRPALFLVAGMLLGLLALTKAVFFYIAVLIVMGMSICFFLALVMRFLKLNSACLALFILGLLLTAGPWVLRNKLNFDGFEISSRGGGVLGLRAFKNQMNSHEILAAFHVWGPGVYKRIVKNTFFDVPDCEYEEGGKAARLNRWTSGFAMRDRQAEAAGKPENAIAFFRILTAERVKMMLHFKEEGHPRPWDEADNYLASLARGMILRNPAKHVLMTIPFAWRGIWCFYGGGVFTLLNALSYVTFMVICFYGVVNKNGDSIAFCLLPLLMLLVHAFLTHNEVRFSTPAIPFMIISFFMVLNFLTNRIQSSKA